MTTVADIFATSREILQDEDAIRYLDTELLRHYNNGLWELRSVRPDIFTGTFSVPMPQATSTNDTFPVSDQFRSAMAMYIAGMAELRDDEFAVSGRAAALIGRLTSKAIGGA